MKCGHHHYFWGPIFYIVVYQIFSLKQTHFLKLIVVWKGNFFLIAASNGQHILLIVKNRKWVWKINSTEGGLHAGVAEAQGLRSVTSLLLSEMSKYSSGIKVRPAPPWDFFADSHWEKRTEKGVSGSTGGSPERYTWPACLPGSPTIGGRAHWAGDTHLPILQMRAEVSCQIHGCLMCIFK